MSRLHAGEGGQGAFFVLILAYYISITCNKIAVSRILKPVIIL